MRLSSLLIAATLAPAALGAQGAGLEIGFRYATAYDEALSPLRYSGPSLVARATASLARWGTAFTADADLSNATLSTSVGGRERPETHVVGSVFALGAEWPRRGGRARSLVPGVRVAGHAALREHTFTAAQSGNRYSGLTQSASDVLVALMPAARLRIERPRGRALELSAAATAFGVERHSYFPGAGDAAPWHAGGPGRILLAEAAARWQRPLGRRTTLGFRYSLRLLRLGGASRLGEASHQVGVIIGSGAP